MGVLVLDNSPDVFVELRPTVSEKSSFPVLGRKDDVIEDLGVGRRTALAEDSTPPGLTVRRTSTTGFAAGRCPFAAPVATHIQALRAFGGLNIWASRLSVHSSLRQHGCLLLPGVA